MERVEEFGQMELGGEEHCGCLWEQGMGRKEGNQGSHISGGPFLQHLDCWEWKWRVCENFRWGQEGTRFKVLLRERTISRRGNAGSGGVSRRDGVGLRQWCKNWGSREAWTKRRWWETSGRLGEWDGALWSDVHERKLLPRAHFLDRIWDPQVLSYVYSTIPPSCSPLLLGRHTLFSCGMRIRPQRRCGLKWAASNKKCPAMGMGSGQWCGQLLVRNLDSPSHLDSACGLWVTACGWPGSSNLDTGRMTLATLREGIH